MLKGRWVMIGFLIMQVQQQRNKFLNPTIFQTKINRQQLITNGGKHEKIIIHFNIINNNTESNVR